MNVTPLLYRSRSQSRYGMTRTQAYKQRLQLFYMQKSGVNIRYIPTYFVRCGMWVK